MKAYTIEDLNNFKRDKYGRLDCPSGDYTQINSFAEWCSFGEGCVFGECSSFGECCYFGESCVFGDRCSFGERCEFSEHCVFGERCSFGEGCSLENNLHLEGIKESIDRVIKIDNIGSRNGCTYFFKTASEIYVRCGCFFGTIAEFEVAVKKTHADNEQYKKEYIEAIRYIKAVI